MFVHNAPIRLELRGVELGRFSSTRCVLTGNLHEVGYEYARHLLQSLLGWLPSDGALFVQSLRAEEPLAQVLESQWIREKALVVDNRTPYQRRRISLPATYSEYLQALPKRRRKDLCKTSKRFRERCDQWQLRVGVSESDVVAMLREIEPISKKTYQARKLGLGIGSDGYFANQLKMAARRGIARCYVLEVNGFVVAWRLGVLWNKVYASNHVGYDPEWSSLHPGVVMQLESLRELIEVSTAETVDFGPGDNAVKRKLSNSSVLERSLYVLPRSWGGVARAVSMRAVESVGKVGRAVESRLHNSARPGLRR